MDWLKNDRFRLDEIERTFLDELYEKSLEITQFRIHRKKIQNLLREKDLEPRNFNLVEIDSWEKALQKVEFIYINEGQFPSMNF